KSVDKIAAGSSSKKIAGNLVRVRNRNGGNRDPAQVAGRDGFFTKTRHGHVALFTYLRHGFIRGCVLSPTRDILTVAVAKPGAHDQLLRHLRLKHRLLWQ